MRNPDTVRDDFAFRKLRKDSDLSADPDRLGIVKDPNMSGQTVSCWKHRHERSVSPTIFYSNRNNKVIKELASRVTQIVRSQAVRASAGSPEDIVSYEDIANDPEVYEAVKASLGIVNERDENDELGCDGKPKWNGKTLYELLRRESNGSDDNSTQAAKDVLASCVTQAIRSAATEGGASEESSVAGEAIDEQAIYEAVRATIGALNEGNNDKLVSSKTAAATIESSQSSSSLDDSEQFNHFDLRGLSAVPKEGLQEDTGDDEDATVLSIKKEGETTTLQLRQSVVAKTPQDHNALMNDEEETALIDIPQHNFGTTPSASAGADAFVPPPTPPTAPCISRKTSHVLHELATHDENPVLLILCCVLVCLTQLVSTTADFVSVLGFAVTLLAIVTSILL